MRTLFVLTFSLMILSVPGSASNQIKALNAEQQKTYSLDSKFFKKSLLVQNILIATSVKVSDTAILETGYLFNHMMVSINDAVAERIRQRKVLCILVGKDELTSEIPQFVTNKTGKELDFYNWRQRGFLRHIDGRPVVLFAEEDVLEYEGGMQNESILIHEFGHVIQGAGFDPTLQKKVHEAFAKAKARSIWNDGKAAQRFRRVKGNEPVSLLDSLIKSFPDQSRDLLEKCLDEGDILVNGKPTNAKIKVTSNDDVLIVFGGSKQCYASRNHAEYWAEGVQCWYDTNRTMDHDHNHIHTRVGIKGYDPGLAKVCEEVLGNNPWRFISPRKRAGKGHLKSFDPANAPKVTDLPHIREAALDYYDKYWSSYWDRLHQKHFPAKSPK
ncbi:hypothetical protein OAF75_03325 [Verrucomicrobiales bacterium]|nr:hypothetical protein [Verrucomicrobiales bacterium]MDB4737849.1 hypothetical protein [Verrucomicrobiales bacterium]